jgi:AbrB family looped-hinge helix DNA binding protein
MKTTAIVSEKGQVTIPKRLRARLGLATGTVLVFEERQGKLIASRAIAEDPIRGLIGWASAAASTSTSGSLRRAVPPDPRSSTVGDHGARRSAGARRPPKVAHRIVSPLVDRIAARPARDRRQAGRKR